MSDKKTIRERMGTIARALPTLWRATGGKKAEVGIGYPYGAGLYTVLFNGEKNMGELGPAINYGVDYQQLRVRGWQAFLESELAQLIINAYTIWIVGSGLKLQSRPQKRILAMSGIDLDSEDYNEDIEALFETWAESKYSDYAGMESLQERAPRVLTNAVVSGDILIILRVDSKTYNPTVQLVDGVHVTSPQAGSDWFEVVLGNGNTLRNGIEQDVTGKHIAYYVRKKNLTFERIEAQNSLGFTVAYMVNGLKFREDNNRCISLLTTVLETAKKLERYKEATVGQAEEQNKNVWQIIQEQFSDGLNPGMKQIANALNPDGADDLPTTEEGRQLADKVQVTTNKKAWFMPRGQKMENVSPGTGQLYFKDFYVPNIEVLCATLRIPPNVALSQYNNAYSASRTATKDWEHTIKVKRKKFADEFYQPIYKLFVHLQVYKNMIQAPGYLLAWYKDDYMVTEAYTAARFTGPIFPHIDPLKEVKAEREKLGPLGANIPLTTVEKAVENLSEGGDSDSITEQFAQELEQAREQGLDLTYNPNSGGNNNNQPAPDKEEIDEEK